MPYKDRRAFANLMREYLAQVKDDNGANGKATAKVYRSALQEALRVFGNRHPRSLILEDFRSFERRLTGSPNTKVNKAYSLKRFAMWCGCKDASRYRPRARRVPKKVGIFPSEDAIQEIRKVARRLGPVHELVFSLGTDNSLRRIDMVRLTKDQALQLLKYGQAEIKWKGRDGGKVAPLALNERTVEALEKYLHQRERLVAKHGRDFDQLLVHEPPPGCKAHQLRPLTLDNISDIVAQISKASGVEFVPHDLRRWFGNRHWKNGEKIETIAGMMAHETIDTTFKCYIGVTIDDMKEAQKRLAAKSCPSLSSQ